jgi:hypothetical protein
MSPMSGYGTQPATSPPLHASSPLDRWYRDVRAGLFTQPRSADEAHQYVGRVAPGQDPVVER